MRHFVVQRRGEQVDVSRGNVADGAVVEEAALRASDGVTAHLDQERLHGVGIELLRRNADDLAQGFAYTHRVTIGPLARHGVKDIGDGNYTRNFRQIGATDIVRIT